MNAITEPAPDPRKRLRLRLLPVPQSAGIARTFVRHHLVSLGHPHLIDDGCLIASELVGNAIAAAPECESWVSLSGNGGRPLLEVWDAGPDLPAPSPATAESLLSETGRGLLIVRELAVRCGHRPLETGKIVWALLA